MKIHMVKQGDTLYLIAKKYNVSLDEIIKANPEISNPDVIDVGMKVKIPSQPKTAIEVIHHHIVQQGDSLWKLSKAWGIQLADMIKANPQLKNPNALLTGEVVNIPKLPHSHEAPEVTMHGGSMSGKANTGMKPGTGIKADTGVQPMPVPTPTLPSAPIVQPPAPPVIQPPVVQQPAPMPIAEMQPTYGYEMHEHIDLFKQFPIPAVEATAQAEMPCPDTLPYGYGMQQPAVSPESSMAGYGNGYSQELSNLHGNMAGNMNGLYSANDYIGYSGCKTCGGPSAWPTSMAANAGAAPYPEMYPGMVNSAGNAPYAGSSYGMSPYSSAAPFGGMSQPQAASPYSQMPQAVSSYGNYPGMYDGGNPGMQVAGVSMFAGAPYGGTPGINGQYAGMTSPAFANGPQVEPYYGGIPPISPLSSIPAMPPMPPMPPLGPVADEVCDDRSSSSDGKGIVTASSVKKRQAKPKQKSGADKTYKSRRKENLPWIKW